MDCGEAMNNLQPLSKESLEYLKTNPDLIDPKFWLDCALLTIDKLEKRKALELPGAYLNCGRHYYACVRGDEECPICDQLAKLESRQKKLVEALKRASKALRFADSPEGRMVYYSELADQLDTALREIGEGDKG